MWSQSRAFIQRLNNTVRNQLSLTLDLNNTQFENKEHSIFQKFNGPSVYNQESPYIFDMKVEIKLVIQINKKVKIGLMKDRKYIGV